MAVGPSPRQHPLDQSSLVGVGVSVMRGQWYAVECFGVRFLPAQTAAAPAPAPARYSDPRLPPTTSASPPATTAAPVDNGPSA